MIEWCIAEGIRWCSITPEITLQTTTKLIEFSEMRHWNSNEFKEECHYTHILPADTFYTSKIFTWFETQQFTPEWIVCMSDTEEFHEREFTIGQYFNCHNAITRDQQRFFTYKSEQDRVCKQLGIPTLPRWSDLGQCIKRDCKHTGFKPLAKYRWQPNSYTPTNAEFAQGWQDIEYIIAPDFVIDVDGVWSLFNVNRTHFKDGMSYHEESPYALTKEEAEQLESWVQRIQGHFQLRCRNICWELMQRRGDTTLYNQDFNPRVGGDYHLRRFGREIGNFNPFAGLFTHTEIPESVYHSNVFWGLGGRSTYEKQLGRPVHIPLEKQEWWVDPQATFSWSVHSLHQRIHTLKVHTR